MILLLQAQEFLQVLLIIVYINFLVDIVRRLPYTPSYLVGKGGITSHDILTKGLCITSARVLGQIINSVPCVMGAQFPYIIFPGNVGTEQSLKEVYLKLK